MIRVGIYWVRESEHLRIWLAKTKPCPECEGEGERISQNNAMQEFVDECTTCLGWGRVEKQKEMPE